MLGALMSGRIADLTGRKGAISGFQLLCAYLHGLLFTFLRLLWSLDLGRFSLGYGIGIISYVVRMFIAEITPKNLRGGLTTVHQLMICSGASFAFVVGTVVAWRTLALTGVVPCFILLLGLLVIPESPRWLAKMGHEKEFEAALQRLCGKDADISEETAEIQEYIETLEKLPKAGIQDLFQSRYARSVIVGVGLIAFQQFGGINGIAFYASEIFVSAGFSSGSVGTISIACSQVPITALGAILTDRIGRRPLLLIASTGTCLGNLLTGISSYLKGHGVLSGWAPILALSSILVFMGSFSLGMGGVPWVIMSEIFPMNIKGIAGSFVTLMHWFAAWVVSYAFNFLMMWSSSGTFFLNAGVSAATVLFIAKLIPETKGRTLEEVQASMNS